MIDQKKDGFDHDDAPSPYSGERAAHHQRDNRNENSRTDNQNSGHGGHR